MLMKKVVDELLQLHSTAKKWRCIGWMLPAMQTVMDTRMIISEHNGRGVIG